MSQQVWEGLESSQGGGLSAPSSQESEQAPQFSSQDESYKLARNPSLLRNGFVDMLQEQDNQAREPMFKLKKLVTGAAAPSGAGGGGGGADLLSGLANASFESEAPMPPRIDIQAQAKAPVMHRQLPPHHHPPGAAMHQHGGLLEPEGAALENLFRAASDDFMEAKGRAGGGAGVGAGVPGSGGLDDPLRRLDLPPVCDRCRRLHRKCDRAMPCSECRMRNSNCVTSASRSSSGPQGGRPPKAKKVALAQERKREAAAQGAASPGDVKLKIEGEPPEKRPAVSGVNHLLPYSGAAVPTPPQRTPREPKKKRLGDDSPGIRIHDDDELLNNEGDFDNSPDFKASLGVDAVQTLSGTQVRQIDPEALLPLETNRLSLSDVTLAFLPSGVGVLSVCDSCTKYNKRCDRRAPCSECILDGKPDQCTRPSKRGAAKLWKQRNLQKQAAAPYQPRY